MPHEGIWCDGDRCVCVLKGICCDGGRCVCVSGVMWVAAGGSLV